jgi:hypothetical protein
MSAATPAPPVKTVWLSKTLWVQFLALASLLSPQVRLWVSENPVEFAAAWAGLNVFLRFVTQGKVSLSGDQGEGSGGSGGLPLIVAMATAAALMGALPSCANYSGPQLKVCALTDQGLVCYSSKNGLSAEVDFTSGK